MLLYNLVYVNLVNCRCSKLRPVNTDRYILHNPLGNPCLTLRINQCLRNSNSKCFLTSCRANQSFYMLFYRQLSLHIKICNRFTSFFYFYWQETQFYMKTIYLVQHLLCADLHTSSVALIFKVEQVFSSFAYARTPLAICNTFNCITNIM